MIEKWFEPFTLLEESSQSDGKGGEYVSWTAATSFQGVLTFTAGSEITAGGQPMLQEAPVLLHDFDVTLVPGDHIRREKNGAVYRVSDRSDNLRAPVFSGLRFCQAQVERLVIPC